MMWFPIVFACAVAIQRLIELRVADRNTKALLARGAQEHNAGHYWAFPALHSLWIAGLVLGPALSAAPESIPWIWLAAYGLLQIGRVWVIATLGPLWTTRILSLPEAPLVQGGPFRFVRHPNYLVVALEIPCGMMVVGQPALAALFGVLNLMLLAWRIRAEDRALTSRRNLPTTQQSPAPAAAPEGVPPA